MIAAYGRHFTIRTQARHWEGRVACIFSLIGLGIALGLASRPDNIAQLTARSETLTSAGYFLLSGVRSDNVLAELYPAPDAIRGPIDYLRTNKLNIFSPQFGLPTLERSKIDNVGNMASCPASTVEYYSRLEDASWQVIGRVGGNQSAQRPKWMIATGLDGDVLGYAPPKRTLADRMFEFALPVHNDSGAFDRKVYLVAEWSDQDMCRYDQSLALPESYFSGHLPPNMFEAGYDVRQSLKGPADKLPEPAQHNDKTLPMIRSTWQGDDTATGSIAYTLESDAAKCTDAYVGVMRGPTYNGLEVQIGEKGGTTETIKLDAVSPHKWWWLKIRHADSCGSSAKVVVRLVDNGRQWGAWAAMTAPVSARPTSEK